MAKSLLDTATYIDIQRAKRRQRESWAIHTVRHAAAYASAHGSPLLSTLSVMEITEGFHPDLQQSKRQDFLSKTLPMFEVVGFDVASACLAGELYARLEEARQRIGVADTGIAAIAITHGLTLVTSNAKHFQRVVDLGFALETQNWRNP